MFRVSYVLIVCGFVWLENGAIPLIVCQLCFPNKRHVVLVVDTWW